MDVKLKKKKKIKDNFINKRKIRFKIRVKNYIIY